MTPWIENEPSHHHRSASEPLNAHAPHRSRSIAPSRATPEQLVNAVLSADKSLLAKLTREDLAALLA